MAHRPTTFLCSARARIALALVWGAFMVSLGAAGCAHKPESILTVGGDKKLSAEDIDRDPLALLPGGALGLLSIDAKAFLASQLGPQALRLAGQVVPLTPEMNFQPNRDLTTLTAAFYTLQGADTALIAQGTFDKDAIERAAARGAITALAQPLRPLEYANNTLYTAGDIGFVLLTSHTLLAGNATGMRRALDRIRDGHVRREVPDWMADLVKTPNAQVAFGADITGQPIASSVLNQVPFLNGLHSARVLGNFQDPGMSFAGALTYPDGPSAARGEGQLKSFGQMASMMNLLRFMGISSPLQSLQTNVKDNDVQFVVTLDGNALIRLLGQLSLAPNVAVPVVAAQQLQ